MMMNKMMAKEVLKGNSTKGSNLIWDYGASVAMEDENMMMKHSHKPIVGGDFPRSGTKLEEDQGTWPRVKQLVENDE